MRNEGARGTGVRGRRGRWRPELLRRSRIARPRSFAILPALRIGGCAIVGCVAVSLACPHDYAHAQLPLSPVSNAGQIVTPVFEGWYRNADGSFSLSFGYFNRNFEEVLEIPIGDDNFIAPGAANQGQPMHFEARRHWGVFAVRVPADFPVDRKVVWTLRIRGETYAIPGSLNPLWQIDALDGEAGSGNTPPVLRFAVDGPGGAGPAGLVGGPVTATAGKPLRLDVWATDDGRVSTSVASGGRANVPVTLSWFKHQGPGSVAFEKVSPEVDRASGRATTSVTFGAPGDYVLRIRANDASGVTGAGHAQCCWSNAFLKVTVR